MELKLDLKKLMICGVALASLVGVGASASNVHGANASSVPEWIRKDAKQGAKQDEANVDKSNQQYAIHESNYLKNHPSERAIDPQQDKQYSNLIYRGHYTKGTRSEQKFDKPFVNKANSHAHKSYKRVPKKRVRKPIRRHHNRKATKLSKRTIKRIMNQIRKDKKVLKRKHASKQAKRYARRNLKKQYKFLKRAKSNKRSLKRSRHARHNHKHASRK